jgi:hypothetical protein
MAEEISEIIGFQVMNPVNISRENDPLPRSQHTKDANVEVTSRFELAEYS